MNDNPQKVFLCDLTTMIKRGISPVYTENGIPVFNQKCIRDSRVNLDLRRKTDPEKRKISVEKFVLLWDVLINSTGVGTLGRMAQIKNIIGISTVDTHVTIARPDLKKVDGRYFGYALNAKQSTIEAMGVGATGQTELSRIRLGKEIAIPIPPLSTQHKISSILSAYDNLIENNTRRIQILEEMAKRIYKEWFVDFKYPGHENDKIVNSELGMIPEGWEVDTLNSFGQISTGRTPPKKDPDNYGDYIPFIKIPDYDKSFFLTNYKEFLSETGAHLVNNIIVPKNTLLITTIATVGLVSITTTTSSYNQNINSLIPKNYSYLYYLLFAIKLQKKYLNALGGGGATFGTVSKSKLSNVKILNPKLEKIELYKDLVKPLFENMLILLKSNQNLRQTRDLLLPKLISGKIDVTDLDIDTSILYD